MRFVLDSMLGKLAKWLRVLGYDAAYRSPYHDIHSFVKEGRTLLSRDAKLVGLYPEAALIRADRVGDQMMELKERLALSPDRSLWFSRCLRCNVPLQKAPSPRASEEIPEYIFYRQMPEVKSCPSCGRFFWPGSHRERMLNQLRRWGFGE
jgi:uncharacterized protein